MDGITVRLWRNRMFYLGLAVRLLAVVFVTPWVQEHWFVPFMRYAVVHPALDPWSNFLAAGGDSMSFPYGMVMLLYHLPFVVCGVIAQSLTGYAGAVQISFSVSLLTADYLLLTTLCRFLDKWTDQIILYYWLSPIALYVTFWHGQTDVIVMLQIVTALLFLRQRRFVWAGVMYALAISAKLSAVIPLPFVLIYLWMNRRNREGFRQFILSNFLLSALIHLLLLLSSGFRSMVFGSPEISRLYDISIPLVNGIQIFIVPLIYVFLLFWAWQLRRLNFEMLFAFIGLSYFLILLATPAAAGWYLWIIPFLAVYQVTSGNGPRVMVAVFSVLLIAVKWVTNTGASIPLIGLNLQPALSAQIDHGRAVSLAMSILTAIGILICVTMVQRALTNNDFFRLSRRPLLIGITGDSGTGKDTLSIALMGLFGEHSTSMISGDDYHRFERSSPMWRTLTHLDPRANNLEAFSRDSIALLEGGKVLFRHYDHSTGHFSKRHTNVSKEVILVSGLHALYTEDLRSRMDLRIFLDMDEQLRQYFKIKRDVTERGHPIEKVKSFIASRRKDYELYILPQRNHANVIFSLQPESADQLKDIYVTVQPRLCLKILMGTAIRCDELVRLLVSVCGIQAEICPNRNSKLIEILVTGDEISADDIKCMAELLVPHLDELLDEHPKWNPGIMGIIQIVVLMLIAEQAKCRS